MTSQRAVNQASLAERIGARLRQLRQERGLTLAALSSRSGVSVSYLSAVEKGINHPSLHTLAAVTEALGVRIPAVLAEEGQTHVHYARLPDQVPANLEVSHPLLQLRSCLVATAGPDRGTCPAPLEHRDLFVYVVDGQIDVHVDGDTFTLNKGDALDATNPSEVSWSTVAGSVTSWTSCPTRVT